MKGTLVKRKDRYDLYNKSDGSKIASSAPNPQGKLSIENCMSIENGYDINQLAIEVYRDFPNKANGDETLPMWGKDEHATKKRKAFIKGFKTAVEILGDRKFTEFDVRDAYHRGYFLDKISDSQFIDKVNCHIQSLQQNEWDVTVVTKNSRTGKIIKSESELEWDEDGLCDRAVPIFDADGCLILKRVTD